MTKLKTEVINYLHVVLGSMIMACGIVIESNRIHILKRLVAEVHPNAYMVIMEATELLGPSRKML